MTIARIANILIPADFSGSFGFAQGKPAAADLAPGPCPRTSEERI
jgi:hypothetical protein